MNMEEGLNMEAVSSDTEFEDLFGGPFVLPAGSFDTADDPFPPGMRVFEFGPGSSSGKKDKSGETIGVFMNEVPIPDMDEVRLLRGEEGQIRMLPRRLPPPPRPPPWYDDDFCRW